MNTIRTHWVRWRCMFLIVAGLFHAAGIVAWSQQWGIVRQPLRHPNGSSVHYTAIAALDSARCITAGTAGGRLILHITENGGRAWRRLIDSAMGLRVRSIAWPTPESIFLAATTGVPYEPGVLLGSYDGGNSWRQLPCDSCSGTQISMYDAMHGGAIRSYSTAEPDSVALTADGGTSWKNVAIPHSHQLRHGYLHALDVQCLGPHTYTMLTYNPKGSPEGDYGPHVVFTTSDGGATWSESDVWRTFWMSFGDQLNGVSVFAGLTGFNGGNLHRVTNLHTTTNGGRTWRALPDIHHTGDDTLSIQRIRVAGARHVIGLRGPSRNDQIFHDAWLSTNLAETWRPIAKADLGGEEFRLGDVAYPDSTAAWGYTTSGHLVRLRLGMSTLSFHEAAQPVLASAIVISDGHDLRASVNLTQPGTVRVEVVNLNGISVAHAEYRELPAGTHTLVLPVEAGCGYYIARMQVGETIVNKPFVVVR